MVDPLYSPLVAATVLALAATATAATPEETEFFEKNIRPIFIEKCSLCHGEQRTAGTTTVMALLACLPAAA